MSGIKLNSGDTEGMVIRLNYLSKKLNQEIFEEDISLR